MIYPPGAPKSCRDPELNSIFTQGNWEGQLSTCSGVLRKGVVVMSTYEELMIIIAVAGLIVAILNMKNKK